MQKFLSLLFLLSVLVLPMFTQATEHYIPEGLVESAQRELDILFSPAHRENYRELGVFTPDDDLSKVRLGRPIPQYLATIEMLLSFPEDESLTAALNIRAWIFPVYIDNTPKIKLGMIKDGEGWRFLSLGAPTNIVKILNKYQIKDKSNHYIIVFNKPGMIYLGIKNSDGSEYLVPCLNTDGKYLGLQRGEDGLFEPFTYSYLKSRVKKCGPNTPIIKDD